MTWQMQTFSFINKVIIVSKFVIMTRRETFYSPHKARSLKDYPKVKINRDRGGE